jgi:hypothetical protein
MARSVTKFDTIDAVSQIYSNDSAHELKQLLRNLPPEQKNLVEVQLDMQRMKELTSLIGEMIKDNDRKSIITNLVG